MKKLFITLIVSLLFVAGVNSQSIANYAFSTNKPVALEDMSAGTTQLIPGSSFQVASGLTDIGFTFNFMGGTYSQFSVNSNGQLQLGALISATGISEAAPSTALIVPMSGSNSILNTGKVHYIVQGTAPYRVLVVEWKDLNIPTPILDNNPPIPEYNPTTIQVLIHESTGKIEFKYGSVNNNSLPTITRAIFISSGNTENTVKYIGSDFVSAVNASAVTAYQLDATFTSEVSTRDYSFSPVSTPTVTVTNNCDGTSTLTASNYTGILLWSTGETTPAITVSVGGDYTVTQTVGEYPSLPATGTAIPVPTITGPMVGGVPAILDGTTITDQTYTTELGMSEYVWHVSAAGTITAGGDGFNFVTVTWTNPDKQQSVSVNYKNLNGCVSAQPTVCIINYYPYAAAIDPAVVPQFVDPMPHFAAGLRVNAKAGGQLTIKTEMTRQIALSKGTVLSTGTIGDSPEIGKGNYAGYGISTDGGATYGPVMWPAQTIECQQGNGVTVQYINNLVGVRYSDFNILADQTLMMNGYTLNGDPLLDPYKGDIPMVVHLHGGEMPSNSDGGPTAWFMPTGNPLQGPGFIYHASTLATYPNKQEATTLWYHPHDQGLTRINVYTGLAGYYLLRGTAEETAKLPGWSGDDKVQEITPSGKTATFNGTNAYLPEIELAVQDRMFNTKGELYWPVTPTNPDLHPYWTPEFFGNIMTVNGKSWPYLSVAPRKYRFRMLDGCNARFLNMWLKNLDTSGNGPKITVVGTDGGLLDTPVDLDPESGKTVFMAPGERLDVVIDFTGVAEGTVFTLMNDANAPYPTGDPVIEGFTDRIMQFVVNGKLIDATSGDPTGSDKSLLPSILRTANPMIKLTDFAGNLATGVTATLKRQILLNEVTGAGGPVQVLFNNSHFDEGATSVGTPQGFGGPTEMPLEGTTEVIQIVNTTIDAHPIHIHLLQWQLVSRQAFDRTGYLNTYYNAWAAHVPSVPIWPAGLGYPGGAGSPYPYLTKNADDAVGGNPAVSPFLTGPVIPANPEENGWKDDIKAFPGEVSTFVVRVAPTDKAINASQQDLLLPFDPSIGPGYVWHCHIIDHEDMDMMRPLVIQPSAMRYPQITVQPQPLVSCVGSTETISVSATSDTDISYLWQISTDGGTVWNDLLNGAPYSGVLTSALHINPITLLMSGLKYRVLLTNIDGVTTSNVASLTVEPNVAVSVDISANKNNVYTGQSVTFTPIPTNGGTAPTYEWLVNSTVVGTGDTYRYAPTNNDQVAVRMTSNAHCATGNPATSGGIIITVLPSVSAGSDGDWNTPATWADNTVPTIADNVVIPIGKTVTVNEADAYCNSVAIEGALTSTANSHNMVVASDVRTDDTFNIGANVLIINGATSGDGVIQAASGTIVYGGTAAQTISNIDGNVINNLTVDNKTGVTLPAALTVSTTLTINAGAKLTNPVASNLTVKNVTILSNLVNGTGTFVDNGTTNTTVGGVANVQQYLTGGRNWYVSSPVTTATTTSISTASAIQSYNENDANWVLESSTLNVLKGYVASIATTGSVTFVGEALNTGDQSAVLTGTGASKTGYNLVGNPYPSYLNWDIATSNSSNLETTVWYRTKNASNTAYVFDTYNSDGQNGTNNNGTRVTEQIPPIQAFWVRVKAPATSGSLNLDNTMRSHEGAVSNRLKTPELFNTTQQKLYLQVSNGTNSDEAIIAINPAAQNGFDTYDSEKMTNANAFIPEIYTFAGTETLAINSLNSVSSNQEIALGFTTGETNTFTIKATEINNFDADTKILLKDKQLGVEKELTTTNSYSFTSSPVTTSTRFSIVFKSTTVVTGVDTNPGSGSESMYIYRNQNNQITVNRVDAIGEGTVTVCNALGQKLVNMSTTGSVTVVNTKLLPGVYMVVVDVQGKTSTKKITLY